MSYNVNLPCGCTVYVSCDPLTGMAHTRILERRAQTCPNRRHETGSRVWLWEMLPTPALTADAAWVGDSDTPPGSIPLGTFRHATPTARRHRDIPQVQRPAGR